MCKRIGEVFVIPKEVDKFVGEEGYGRETPRGRGVLYEAKEFFHEIGKRWTIYF